MIDQNGKWAPDLAPKGYLVLNDYHRFLLLSGPRLTAKTTCAIAKLARHLWENDQAMVAIVGKSIRAIKSSGIWQDLTVLDTGIKQWLKANIGFEYEVEPKITGDTKMSFFKIRNMYYGMDGYTGLSECQVHSLEHDHEVEQKFKSTRYSMFYLPEADLFKSESVMQIMDDQLRIPSIPDENHQIILDCNPAEEGPDHWIYRAFYRKCGEDGEPYAPTHAAKFQTYEFFLEDNPFISEDRKQAQRDKYAHDKIKKARYVDGKWERDASGGVFEHVWSESSHIVGAMARDEILIPGKDAHEFITGWDTGDVNHGLSILCPRSTETQTVFDLIDELVIIDRKVSLADFTEGVLEKMDYWERVMRALYGDAHVIVWRHWSDPSAADRYRSAADSYDAKIIRQASGGRINLNYAAKAAGSVRRRKDLLSKILFDGRLAVSAQCHAHIEMFRYLKPGPSAAEPIQRASPHKHAFDALSYALSSEAPMELDRRNQATVVRKPHIISVG